MVKHDLKGLIFNIQRYSVHDGPGARTTVFFKGCPLRCLWCSNPESQKICPEIAYNSSKCIKCYRCVDACPNKAIYVKNKEDFITINRKLCNNCRGYWCIEECYQGALELIGRYITVEDLLKEVKKDSLLYRNSGGGVTLSGGEPTSQPDFILHWIKRCRESGIHTVLDTCGYADWETMKKIIKNVNLVFYDIKHMDPVMHKKLTGVSNSEILKNAKLISEEQVPIVIRIPLIPGYNDSKENLEKTADFIKKVGVKEVNLLPYHRLGIEKYKKLNKIYKLNEVLPPTDEYLQNIKEFFNSQGLLCSVI